MSDTKEIKVEEGDFICESNREVRAVFDRFINDNLYEKYKDVFGKNGWGRINKGIYFNIYEDENKQRTFLRVAVQEDKFDNEYLLEHSLDILRKIVSEQLPGAKDQNWGTENGTGLNIYGKGKATHFKFLESEV